MRNSGAAASIRLLPSKSAGERPRRPRLSVRPILLIGFGLAHDLLRREVDAAGREGVADEEVVRLTRVIVLAVLEVWILNNGERQLDRLGHDMALEGIDRGLHGDGHLG